mmetsp:Transcript_7980/g.26731  ORF Transcript_7980/g.26731 Transcript_7980/m.26731 type:complete len:385 (-) Transcript_7980:2312-3466(-)
MALKAMHGALIIIAIMYCCVGSINADLTARLVDDSDNMANIVGARETQELVDYKLRQVQAKRNEIAEKNEKAKKVEEETYKEYAKAAQKAAEAANLKRHLKEKFEIDSQIVSEKKAVADKAEKIAKAMEALAAKATGEFNEAKKTKMTVGEKYKTSLELVKTTSSAKKSAEEARFSSEEAAQKTAKELSRADQEVRTLLQKHTKLEEIALSEDKKQTTRLADAFKQDAARQKAFRQALAKARLAEKAQRKQAELERKAREEQMREYLERQGHALASKRDRKIQSLTSFMKSLLRANPELEKFRPRDFPSDDNARAEYGKGEAPRGWAESGTEVKRARREEGKSWRGGVREQAADAGNLQELSDVDDSYDDGYDFTVPSSPFARV